MAMLEGRVDTTTGSDGTQKHMSRIRAHALLKSGSSSLNVFI